MKRAFLKNVLALAAAAALAGPAAPVFAAEREVNIAYQTVVEPAKVAQADGEYEKASGWKINWKKFASGGDVITAVASGDIQIGYVGSSPLAAAATKGLPIETIFIAAEIGDAEALVVATAAASASRKTWSARRSRCRSSRPPITACWRRSSTGRSIRSRCRS